jgi:REP element-mobilizing transposase RayT
MALLTTYYPQFFTATILDWKPLLKEDKYKDIIVSSLRFLVDNKRVKVFSFVIMPNHLHIIWQIQPGHEREEVQRDFLKYTAQKIRFDLMDNNPELLKEFEVVATDRKYQFWERNTLSIDLYSRDTLIQKLQYTHRNPVHERWTLSSVPEGYHYSSALFYETGVDNWNFLTHYVD